MNKKVAIYIRVSTLDQAREGYSLEVQEQSLRAWCNDRKYDIYDIYADKGVSGKNISRRPDMGRLIQDARSNKFDIVLFWALSRFTRSVSDLYNTMEILKEHNIDMVSYTEAFDTSTPMGRAMTGIIGVFAQLERELNSERTRAAMETRAKQGKRTCNEVLGYDIVGKDDLIINKVEAEYVKTCFEEYLARKSLTEVAAICNEKGYKGKRGKTPTASSVQVILTRPIYCGYNSFNGKLYKGSHPAIIPVDLFNKVQRLLKRMGRISYTTIKQQ